MAEKPKIPDLNFFGECLNEPIALAIIRMLETARHERTPIKHTRDGITIIADQNDCGIALLNRFLRAKREQKTGQIIRLSDS